MVLRKTNTKLLSKIMGVAHLLQRVLHLLSIDDEIIVADSVAILFALVSRKKNLYMINRHDGFALLFKVLCCAVLCCAVLCCAVMCCAVL